MTVKPYKIGFCPQCGTQIQVKDPTGRWTSFKSNHSQVDLVFDDGLKMRSAICKECAKAPDYCKLTAAVLAEGSQACNAKTRDRIKFKKDKTLRGDVVSHEVKAPLVAEK